MFSCWLFGLRISWKFVLASSSYAAASKPKPSILCSTVLANLHGQARPMWYPSYVKG